MVNTPSYEETSLSLNEANSILDQEAAKLDQGIVNKFLTWGALASTFLKSHGNSFDLPSPERTEMDHLLLRFRGEMVGVAYSERCIRFGSCPGNSVEISPNGIVLRTYGPKGEKENNYLVLESTNHILNFEESIDIPIKNLVEFVRDGSGTELLIGDVAVERAVLEMFPHHKNEYAEVLRQYGKTLIATKPKNDDEKDNKGKGYKWIG